MTRIPLKALTLLCALSLSVTGCARQSEESADPATGGPEASPTEWADLLPNARRPIDGVVSGGQPTAEQLAQAAEAGYRSVINLRMPGERGGDDEAALVAGLGMEYLPLPIDGAGGITEDNARELRRLLDQSEGPVLLHCGSGNRVGALLALGAYHVDGSSADDALRYGLDSGLTKLESTVREHLEAASSN